MSWLLVTALLVALAVLLIVGVWAYQTAHRLDRLHVRYDLSWQALDSALARRAVVARAVAVDAYGAGPRESALRRWQAPRSRRQSRQGGRRKRIVGGARARGPYPYRSRSSPNRPMQRLA